LKARKPQAAEKGKAGSLALQWGRAVEGAETVLPMRFRGETVQASTYKRQLNEQESGKGP